MGAPLPLTLLFRHRRVVDGACRRFAAAGWIMETMTVSSDAREWAQQGIDLWARHGVEELAARDAVERAELGEPAPAPTAPSHWAWDGEIAQIDPE